MQTTTEENLCAPDIYHLLARRTYALPTNEESLAISLSDDVIFNWHVYAIQHRPAAQIEQLAWDLHRRCGDERGYEIFAALVEEWGDVDKLDAVWASCCKRPELSSDRHIISELISLHHRGQMLEILLPDDGEDVRNELDALADRFDELQFELTRKAFEPYRADTALIYEPLHEQFKALEQAHFARNVKLGKVLVPTSTTNTPITAVSGGIPLTGMQDVIADLGQPILTGYLVGQQGKPSDDAPSLPQQMRTHPLFDQINAFSGYAVALAERSPATFRVNSVVESLAVLSLVHEETLNSVVSRIRASGVALPEGKLYIASRSLEARAHRAVRTGVGWRLNARGEPDPMNADNIAVFLRMIDVTVRFNAWRRRVEVQSTDGEWAPLTDAELNRLRGIASCEEHRFRPSKEFFRDMLADLARQHSYDPVLDYVDTAIWDGVPRLTTWLSRACGVPCDPYHQAIGRNVIGGIVKRARHPGAKHDEVMILIGNQGCGKSNLTKELALNSEWHTDSVTFEGRPQDIVPQMHGRLIIEMSELDGVHRRDVGYIKRFLSTQNDNYTAKYDALATDHARRCIFIGTCNLDTPLVDDTGNRRFYPVRIPDGVQIDIPWIRANVRMLIAEAAHLESEGETFEIPREVWAIAAGVQEAARSVTAVEELLLQWFSKPVLNGTAGYFILSADIVSALVMARQNSNAKVGGVMDRLGYKNSRPYIDGVQQRAWVKSSTGRTENCVRLVPTQGALGGPIEMRPRSLHT